MKRCVTVAAGMLCASGMAWSGVLYVDASAPAGGDGASWASAYSDLAVALDAAQDGDEVRVAQGLYLPDGGTGDVARSFSPRSGVTVLGGYAGLAGANPDARDPRAYVAVLSGDLNGDDGPDFTNREDNASNVIFLRDVERVVLDGFTVRGGYARLSFRQDGGGLNAAFSKFAVRDCVFTDNLADWYGSAMGLLNSFAGDIDVIDTMFVGNYAVRFGTIATYTTSPRFINCYVAGNTAQNGAGFYIGSNALIVNCTVVHNRGTGSGSSVGCAIFNNGGTPLVVNSILRDNGEVGSEFANIWVAGGTPTFRNTSIGGLSAYAGNGNVNLPANFENLAGSDGVIGTPDDQPRLPADSPLRDLGDGEAVPEDVTTDLFGGPRIVGKTVDLGVDEFGCPGDVDGNGVVNFLDLNTVLSNYGQTTPEGDLNGDGVVNFLDLNTVLSGFGIGCGW